MSETSAAFRTAEVRGIGMRDGERRARIASASGIDSSADSRATGVERAGALAVCAPLSSARIAQIAQ